MTATALNFNTLTIAGISIKQDLHGRYCLNDLHKAAGNEAKHKPDNWKRAQQTIDLISLLESENCNFKPVDVINGGLLRGTYVVKELVYAYAMWISAKFHITVIRAYDSLVNKKSDYGLKEQLEMFDKPRPINEPAHPTMMNAKMKNHIQHAIDLTAQSYSTTTNSIVRDLADYFQADNWEMIPMWRYPDICAYFNIKPRFKAEDKMHIMVEMSSLDLNSRMELTVKVDELQTELDKLKQKEVTENAVPVRAAILKIADALDELAFYA